MVFNGRAGGAAMNTKEVRRAESAVNQLNFGVRIMGGRSEGLGSAVLVAAFGGLRGWC